MRPHSVSVLVVAVGVPLAACGLSTMGEGPPSLGWSGDDGSAVQPDGQSEDVRAAEDAPPHDAPATTDAQGAETSVDAFGPDVPGLPDAPAGDGWTCNPLDAGILGQLDLSTCIFAGTASWNENNDGKITLTNSNNFEAGAAWLPTQMPQVSAYDLTWSFRVGPGDTAGDGITFAVLQVAKAPDNKFVGSDGSGLGLQGLTGTGYAIAVDMYNTNAISLVTMPDFTTVASNANGDRLNDGNVHSVDVSWRAPSTITATLHSTSGDLTVTSSAPGLTVAGAAWFGFTGATGGGSNSHNEVASLVVNGVCQ